MGERGPKAKSGKRTPSGQLSRSNSAKRENAERQQIQRDRAERDNMSVAITARQRVHGISNKHAANPYSGDVIGRLLLEGEATGISQTQYDAARQFMQDQLANSRISCSPKPAGAVNLNAVHGRHGDEEINVERDKAIKAKYIAARNAVADAQQAVAMQGNLFGAMNAILDKDVLVRHLVGDLREALNALAKHYGIG